MEPARHRAAGITHDMWTYLTPWRPSIQLCDAVGVMSALFAEPTCRGEVDEKPDGVRPGPSVSGAAALCWRVGHGTGGLSMLAPMMGCVVMEERCEVSVGKLMLEGEDCPLGLSESTPPASPRSATPPSAHLSVGRQKPLVTLPRAFAPVCCPLPATYTTSGDD